MGFRAGDAILPARARPPAAHAGRAHGQRQGVFTGAGQLGGEAQKSDGWIRLAFEREFFADPRRTTRSSWCARRTPELWGGAATPGTLEHAIYEALAHGGLFVPALRAWVTQLMSVAAPLVRW